MTDAGASYQRRRNEKLFMGKERQVILSSDEVLLKCSFTTTLFLRENPWSLYTITVLFNVIKSEMSWCLNNFVTSLFFRFLSVGSDKQRQPREETKEVRSTNQRVEDKMWRAANWGGQCTEGSSQLFHWGESFFLSVIQAVFIHYRKTLCNWLKNLSWHSWSIRSSTMTSPFLVSLVFPSLASCL